MAPGTDLLIQSILKIILLWIPLITQLDTQHYLLGPNWQEHSLSLQLMAETHYFSEKLSLKKLETLFKIAVML